MKTGAIQELLAERIAAIQLKHALPGMKTTRNEEQRSGLSATGGLSASANTNTKLPVALPRQTLPVPIEDRMLRAPHTVEASAFQISNLKFPMPTTSCGVLATGLLAIDQALGGGLRPGLHEWYAAKERQQGNEATRQRNENNHEATKRDESFNHQSKVVHRQFESAPRLRSGVGHGAPLCLLVHLAWRALEAHPAKRVVWIGKNCFPYPAVLTRDFGRDLGLLRRSLFVRAESPADRVWVADLSIRCGLAGAVIVDGAELDMAATRRLQLSGRSQQAFVFLARPPQDLDRLSAASTRWLVRTARHEVSGNDTSSYRHITTSPHHQVTPLPNPLWSLDLLRCKGMQPSTSRPVWLVEWNRAANVIRIPAPVCDSFVEHGHEATKARRHGR